MFANAGGDLWPLMTVAGVIILGLVIAYGMMRSRSKTAREHAHTEQATANLYAAEEREAKSNNA